MAWSWTRRALSTVPRPTLSILAASGTETPRFGGFSALGRPGGSFAATNPANLPVFLPRLGPPPPCLDLSLELLGRVLGVGLDLLFGRLLAELVAVLIEPDQHELSS